VHEAMFYERLAGNSVRCQLCHQQCVIADRHHGLCGVRENHGGTLYSVNYGRVIAAHVDPIEKKPLFHFYPGSRAFSVATAGCNFRCAFCQNWDISQASKGENRSIGGHYTEPQAAVEAALRTSSRVIAFTYTEPTVFYEWALDVARAAAEKDLKTAFVTNGYIRADPLDSIQPFLHAANVDLKAFRDESYRRVMGAALQPVLDTLIRMKRLGIWVEVTTLVVTDLNDSEDELRDIARFISSELGPETPWHVSRFHPDFRYTNVPPTNPHVLKRAHELGQEEGLHYVYVGNLPGTDGENTRCHKCGNLLVNRIGFHVVENRIATGSTCPQCGERVAGVGMEVVSQRGNSSAGTR